MTSVRWEFKGCREACTPYLTLLVEQHVRDDDQVHKCKYATPTAPNPKRVYTSSALVRSCTMRLKGTCTVAMRNVALHQHSSGEYSHAKALKRGMQPPQPPPAPSIRAEMRLAPGRA